MLVYKKFRRIHIWISRNRVLDSDLWMNKLPKSASRRCPVLATATPHGKWRQRKELAKVGLQPTQDKKKKECQHVLLTIGQQRQKALGSQMTPMKELAIGQPSQGWLADGSNPKEIEKKREEKDGWPFWPTNENKGSPESLATMVKKKLVGLLANHGSNPKRKKG